jgi:hypothetical protein
VESELEIRDRLARYDAEGTKLKGLKDDGNLSELGQKRLETLEDFSFICRCILAESDEDKQKKRNRKIEKLAAIDHDQWIYWSSGVASMIQQLRNIIFEYENYLIDNISEEEYEILVANANRLLFKNDVTERMKLWERLQKTPYAELSEEYKNDDRKWADIELKAIEGE